MTLTRHDISIWHTLGWNRGRGWSLCFPWAGKDDKYFRKLELTFLAEFNAHLSRYYIYWRLYQITFIITGRAILIVFNQPSYCSLPTARAFQPRCHWRLRTLYRASRGGKSGKKHVTHRGEVPHRWCLWMGWKVTARQGRRSPGFKPIPYKYNIP